MSWFRNSAEKKVRIPRAESNCGKDYILKELEKKKNPYPYKGSKKRELFG